MPERRSSKSGDGGSALVTTAHGAAAASKDGRPTLDVVSSRLGIAASRIVYCCIVGSRLWGTNSRESDWDTVVVVDSEDALPGRAGGGGAASGSGKGARGGKGGGRGGGKRSGGAAANASRLSRDEAAALAVKTSVHSGNLDAALMTADAFTCGVYAHMFLPLACLSVPADFVVAGAPPPGVPAGLRALSTAPGPGDAAGASSGAGAGTGARTRVPLPTGLQPARLLAAIEEETSRDWARIEKAMSKGDVARGRKETAHTLRMVLLATQLVQHGRITDFGAANETYYALLHAPERDWASHAAAHRPLFDDTLAALRDECTRAERDIHAGAAPR